MGNPLVKDEMASAPWKLLLVLLVPLFSPSSDVAGEMGDDGVAVNAVTAEVMRKKRIKSFMAKNTRRDKKKNGRGWNPRQRERERERASDSLNENLLSNNDGS